MDSMQFYGDLLTEIIGESAPASKNLHLKQNAIELSKTMVAPGTSMTKSRPRHTDSRNRILWHLKLPPFENGWLTRVLRYVGLQTKT